MSKTEKSLEEQIKEKRENEMKLFQDEYKAICEKYGYALEPVVVIKSSGVNGHLDIVATKNI